MTKRIEPKFIAGDYFTGIDRSYPRSLYRFDGVGKWGKKAIITHICFDGKTTPTIFEKERWPMRMVNDEYRLATPEEINIYRENKLDSRQLNWNCEGERQLLLDGVNADEKKV